MLNVPTVVTVSQINMYIKSLLDENSLLRHVFISGEISNFTNHYRSGHYYLTLKDDKAAIKAVMFRSQNERLRFLPQNGMKVIARGRISVYDRDGVYQLYIDDMQPDGLGALNLAFEQLKEKLEAEGLFAQERKQLLPRFPSKIGVITSPTGAAVQDILNVLSRRFPLAQVVFCPVQVQGEQAAPQIARAIRRFSVEMAADVLIVGRGGGSLEDLWAFNEEQVARAVADCRIPIISAVGHETDYTICDFVADLRAPTPSAAAELAAPDQYAQQVYIGSLFYTMEKKITGYLENQRTRLSRSSGAAILKSPDALLMHRRQRLDSDILRLTHAALGRLEGERGRFAALGGKLHVLSPFGVLARGYAIAYNDKKELIHSVNHCSESDPIQVQLSDGVLSCRITDIKQPKKSEGQKV